MFSDHEKKSNKQFLVQFLIQSKEEKVNESHLLAPRALVKEYKKRIQFQNMTLFYEKREPLY